MALLDKNKSVVGKALIPIIDHHPALSPHRRDINLHDGQRSQGAAELELIFFQTVNNEYLYTFY